jgi:hypothetical protein
LNCSGDDLPRCFFKVCILTRFQLCLLFRVSSLVWNKEDSELYIGGLFNSIDNVSISSGLAIWTRKSGLIGFPSGGISNSDGSTNNCWVQSLQYDSVSKSLFVGGNFDKVNGEYCSSVAVWQRLHILFLFFFSPFFITIPLQIKQYLAMFEPTSFLYFNSDSNDVERKQCALSVRLGIIIFQLARWSMGFTLRCVTFGCFWLCGGS